MSTLAIRCIHGDKINILFSAFTVQRLYVILYINIICFDELFSDHLYFCNNFGAVLMRYGHGRT